MPLPSKTFLTILVSAAVLAPISGLASEAGAFLVKAPEGGVLQLRAGAWETAGTEGLAELLDGVLVQSIGCKAAEGATWCLVRYEATEAVGWANAADLEQAPPFGIAAGSGDPVAEADMPAVCQAEAGKAFGVAAAAVELLEAKPEFGGFSLDGTAESRDPETGLVPFKCLFDHARRFSDVMSLKSDGE